MFVAAFPRRSLNLCLSSLLLDASVEAAITQNPQQFTLRHSGLTLQINVIILLLVSYLSSGSVLYLRHVVFFVHVQFVFHKVAHVNKL